MTDTFNSAWVPLASPQGQGTLRQRKVRFGDGYVQRAPDGINTHLQSWALSWAGAAATVFAIRDFLVAHVGQTFFWTPPGGTQGYYACEAYDSVPVSPGVYQLTATFVEDAVP
jgi:phage-related protein